MSERSREELNLRADAVLEDARQTEAYRDLYHDLRDTDSSFAAVCVGDAYRELARWDKPVTDVDRQEREPGRDFARQLYTGLVPWWHRPSGVTDFLSVPGESLILSRVVAELLNESGHSDQVVTHAGLTQALGGLGG